MPVKSPGTLVPLACSSIVSRSPGAWGLAAGGLVCTRSGQQLLKPLDKNPEPRGAPVPSLQINPSACVPVRFGVSEGFNRC